MHLLSASISSLALVQATLWQAATEAITLETNNTAAEDRQAILKEHRAAAVQAFNKTAQLMPPAQYRVG